VSPRAEPTSRAPIGRVLRRIFAVSGSRLWSAYGALLAAAAESLVETAVFSVLLALMFLSIAPVATLKQAARGMEKQVDWVQRLGWVHTETPQARLHSLLLFAGLMLGAAFFRAVFTFGRSYLAQHFSLSVVRDLRQRLYEHLLRQSLSFYRARETGDLLSRVSNDVAALQRLLGYDLMDAARSVISMAAALVMMVKFDWRLTLLALVCAPAVSSIIARSGARMRGLMLEVQRRLGKLNAFLQERISGVETVQVFGMEGREAESFREINQGNYRANLRAVLTLSTMQPVIDLIAMAALVVLLVIAGYLAITGPLSLPTIISFAYLGQIFGSRLSLLGKIWLAGQQAAAAGDRVFEMLDVHEEVPELPGASGLPRVRGEIAFRHVSFQYGENEPVLRDVEVTISPGEVVALVGASGAGKTSLVRLLPRFYDPTSGHIEIDGVDTRTVTLRSLRSQIGIVPQEPILFSGTVGENIAYGRPGASPEEVRAAAQAANAREFIEAMPRGLDTAVGERASTLSGGQRQRLAIARALLCDPRVLILDEATSALDAESEALVQSALENLMRGRTTLVIAHRFSTIQHADRILVLSDGRIAEDGTHGELMRNGGIYCRLYESQFLAAQPEAEHIS